MTSPSRLPLSTSYRHSVNSLEVSADPLPKPTIAHGVSDLTVAKHSSLTLREVPSLGLTPLYGPSQATHLTESASPLTQPHRPGTTTEATPSRHGRHLRLRPPHTLRKSSSKVTTAKTTNSFCSSTPCRAVFCPERDVPLSTELNPLTRTRRSSHPLLNSVGAPDRDTKTTSPSRLPLSTSYWHSVNSLEVSADPLPEPTITHDASDLTVVKHSFLTLREAPSLGLTPLYGPSQATHFTESASLLTQLYRPGIQPRPPHQDTVGTYDCDHLIYYGNRVRSLLPDKQTPRLPYLNTPLSLSQFVLLSAGLPVKRVNDDATTAPD
ncbi:hypothetical protein P167DRAFT_550190 [Morchella conica CCBAS932]|uniref:Uncharacterized protein n=1 Tax=Morchella conica CCBAS932 TaxID=1392247 RepID=A0A3N4K8Q2_9PEZI|nr:hypothetical protein P167DRAFT_550190 [Morchella conica CCBAS932]